MPIQINFTEAQKALDRLEKNIDREIIKAYSKALKELRGMMGEYYARYNMTYAEMARYNRLQALEAEVITILRDLHKGNVKTLTDGLNASYEESFYRVAYSLESNAQLKLGYGILNPEVIKAAVGMPISGLTLVDRLEHNRAVLIVKFRQEITQGLILGEGYQKMAQRIKGSLEGDTAKARTIVATEAHRVQIQGRLASMEHAQNKGLDIVKVWDATLDKRTRPDHQRMDGQKADINGYFHFPSGGITQGPGLSGNPKQDIRCRCALRAELPGFEPTVRRARGEDGKNQVIPYTTYEEWAGNRLGRR